MERSELGSQDNARGYEPSPKFATPEQSVATTIPEQSVTTKPYRPRSRWKENVGLTGTFIALCIFLSITAHNFLTVSNLTNILHQITYLGVIAWAMTLVIIAGEIDISVASAAAFDGVLLALLLQAGFPSFLAILAVLAVGATIGAVAGFTRALFLIPSFIITLALYLGLRGLAELLTNAVPQAPTALTTGIFAFLGSGSIGPIPAAVVILIVLFGMFLFLSTKTTFGRSVYAIGGNAQAARLAGLPLIRIRVILFALSGLMAAVAGILLASNLGVGDPETAVGLEFEAIAAVIVGGTNLFGGTGSLFGTALGVLIIGTLTNGLVILGVNSYASQLVNGLVILAAVLINSPGFRDRIRSLPGLVKRTP